MMGGGAWTGGESVVEVDPVYRDGGEYVVLPPSHNVRRFFTLV